jgi:hypothetical protein
MRASRLYWTSHTVLKEKQIQYNRLVPQGETQAIPIHLFVKEHQNPRDSHHEETSLAIQGHEVQRHWPQPQGLTVSVALQNFKWSLNSSAWSRDHPH